MRKEPKGVTLVIGRLHRGASYNAWWCYYVMLCPDSMSHVFYHYGSTKVHGIIQYVFKGEHYPPIMLVPE